MHGKHGGRIQVDHRHICRGYMALKISRSPLIARDAGVARRQAAASHLPVYGGFRSTDRPSLGMCPTLGIRKLSKRGMLSELIGICNLRRSFCPLV